MTMDAFDWWGGCAQEFLVCWVQPSDHMTLNFVTFNKTLWFTFLHLSKRDFNLSPNCSILGIRHFLPRFLFPPAGLGPDPHIHLFLSDLRPNWLIHSGRAPPCCHTLARSAALHDLAQEETGRVLRGEQGGCCCNRTPAVIKPSLLFRMRSEVQLSTQMGFKKFVYLVIVLLK